MNLGYNVNFIRYEEEWINKLTNEDIVVIDSYDLHLLHFNQIKQREAFLICIDDIHDKVFNADLIINHSPGVNESCYKTIGDSNFALGLEYTLLRNEFYQKKIVYKKENNIFICIGATDSTNFSQIICNKLIKNKLLHLHVVSNKIIKKLNNNIHIYHNLTANQICNLIDCCEISILSASTISIEAFVRNANLLIGMTAENQSNIYKGLTKYKNVYGVNTFNEESVLEIEEIINKKKFINNKDQQIYNNIKLKKLLLKMLI